MDKHYTTHLHDMKDIPKKGKHDKKILHKFFLQVVAKSKKFEIRKEDDCVYNIGDIITLHELDDKSLEYTGRKVDVRVTSRITYDEFPQGLQEGYVILSIDTKGSVYN